MTGLHARRRYFDPAEHTVPEVEAYLSTVSAPEAARVIEEEQSGKARVTILDAQVEETDEEPDSEIVDGEIRKID